MNHSFCPQPKRLPRHAAAKAFTLIEILIVVALTAVLFALLLVPLISALRYTQQAQIVTAAQDAARITKERISRELGSAIFVFDGTSHPFQLPTGTMIAPGDDAYTNFLDLQILNSTGGPVIAHAYNAKLDFVLPKLNDAGGTATTDPTTGLPITYSKSPNGSAIVSNPSYVFPLAAGTNMIRYFIGLKDPTLSYNNTREGVTVSGVHRSDDNTYVLYRAEFQPYMKNSGAAGVSPNANLFATRLNSSGTLIPELDDPDFFRYVSTSDVNWLNDNHNTYSAMEVTAHNARVDKWIQIAKTVIPGPNVDLLLLPHNADNTLAYDPTGGAFPGVAHSGAAIDPVTGATYPIISTSCTFRPATVSGNATPGTTSDYSSQGAVSVDQSGFSYIPTVYTATSQSWSLPYHVSLYPGNYDPSNAALSIYYDTEQFAAGQTTVASPSGYSVAGSLSLNPGDILEYRHLNTDTTAQGTLVYDVTQGFPVTANAMGGGYTLGGTQFVPMTINPDTGTITFSAPSLPNGPLDRFTRQRSYTPDVNGVVDLTQPVNAPILPSDSPLTNEAKLTTTSTTTLTGVDHAHVVPGSVRVYGPDQTSGPNTGNLISYTEVNSAAGTVGDNQFSVNYAANTLQFNTSPTPITTPVQVVYDYQANMTFSTPVPSPTPTPPAPLFDLPSNPYLPMQVKVDYQTRDLIDVSIGVRIYDVTNNRAQVIPAETKIKVGNSNR